MFAKIFRTRSGSKSSSNIEQATSSSSSTSTSTTLSSSSVDKRSPLKQKQKQKESKDKEKEKDKGQTFPRNKEGRRKASQDGSKKSVEVRILPIPALTVPESGEPIMFSEEELLAMTGNYKMIVGKGGFGSVYKGQVVDSASQKKLAVAVKVLHSEQQGMEEDLMREIVAVAKLQHPNILKLVGYCNAADTKAMVYDYMGGGDVDELLRKCRDGTKTFSWEQRLDVALGCAKALAFMHDQNFVHRDIKSSNILLADDLSPRIADFGLVKFIQDWHSHCTTRVKGSIGYIDPMYFTIGHVHTKSDVYAFGVLMVELITGKSVHRDQIHEIVIPSLTAGKVTEALVREILDPTIPQDSKVTLTQAKVLAELARRSLQDHWESRPNMKDLIQKITRLKNTALSENPT